MSAQLVSVADVAYHTRSQTADPAVRLTDRRNGGVAAMSASNNVMQIAMELVTECKRSRCSRYLLRAPPWNRTNIRVIDIKFRDQRAWS